VTSWLSASTLALPKRHGDDIARRLAVTFTTTRCHSSDERRSYTVVGTITDANIRARHGTMAIGKATRR